MNTISIRIFIAVLLVALSTACTSMPAPTQALTPITVQLAWTHQAQFAGMYAADQLGLYAQEGLAVTFLEGGSGVDKFTPVLDDIAQFGVAGADELILARAQGKDLQAFATIFRRSPIVFISLAEKDITRPQDFAGRTIRAPSNIVLPLHAMMSWVGIGADQYTIVDLPSDLSMFAGGEIPVWGVYLNGFVVAARQAGYELNLIYPDDYGVHFYSDTLFTTGDLIESNPELVARFLRATLKGWTFGIENPEEASAFVQKYEPTADPMLEFLKMNASLPLINTGEDNIGWMKPEVWAGMEQTLREQDVLPAPLAVTQVYTMQFLEEIYK